MVPGIVTIPPIVVPNVPSFGRKKRQIDLGAYIPSSIISTATGIN